MTSGKYLFTSESVSMGHPDKLADQISDGVLDALLAQDPKSRVACETLVTTDYCLLAGEITSTAKVDFEKVARDVISAVGYTHDDIGFNYYLNEMVNGFTHARYAFVGVKMGSPR